MLLILIKSMGMLQERIFEDGIVKPLSFFSVMSVKSIIQLLSDVSVLSAKVGRIGAVQDLCRKWLCL